jgi:hypothetical protein
VAFSSLVLRQVSAAFSYLYFGSPGDDASEVDVSDIAAVYYDLDEPISSLANFARNAA